MAGWRDGLKKVGRFYQYRFLHRGQLFTGSTKCEGLADARECKGRLQSKIARAEHAIYDPPTVEAAYRAWVASKESFTSKANLTRARVAIELHVLPIIGKLKADQVRNPEVEKVMRTYLKAKGPSGRPHTADGANILLAYTRAVFNYLVENRYITRVPFNVKKQRTQVKPRATVPIDKLKDFLSHLETNAHPHIGVAVKVMLFLGLRETEALGMRWEWINAAETHYTPGKTKGKEAVALPIPPDLMELLRQLPNRSDWVLPGDGGQPHFQQFTRKAIQRAGVAIGIQGLTPHRLRATFATLLAQSGTNVYEIQKLLRHKQISTTLHYVQTDEQRLQYASCRLWDQAFRPVAPPEPARAAGGQGALPEALSRPSQGRQWCDAGMILQFRPTVLASLAQESPLIITGSTVVEPWVRGA